MIVVTRHPALVDLLREREITDGTEGVLSHATPEDVRGQHVIGVLPLALAAEAASVTEVPLQMAPEDRGQELGIERLRQIAGEPVTYAVMALPKPEASEMEVLREVRSSDSPYAVRTVFRAPASAQLPCLGDWIDRGKVGNVRTIDLQPRADAPLAALIDGDIEPFAGETLADDGVVLVEAAGGDRAQATAVFARPGACVALRHGYKGRSRSVAEISATGVRYLSDSEIADRRGGGQSCESALAEQLRAAGLGRS